MNKRSNCRHDSLSKLVFCEKGRRLPAPFSTIAKMPCLASNLVLTLVRANTSRWVAHPLSRLVKSD